MPLPAYTDPAMPPFSLKADPVAAEDFPGSISAVEERQVWEGWPVPEGLAAAEAVKPKPAEPRIKVSKMIFFIGFFLY